MARAKRKTATKATTKATGSRTGKNVSDVGNKTLSIEDGEAQAVLRAQKWIKVIDEADRRGAGVWFGIPQNMIDWRFVRAGKRGEPSGEALAAQLEEKGYMRLDYSWGIRCTGFEEDGEAGLYLGAPPAVYKMLRARRLAIEKQMHAKLAGTFNREMASISNLMPVGVDVMEAEGDSSDGGAALSRVIKD